MGQRPEGAGAIIIWDTHRIVGAQIDDITFYDNLKPDLARIIDRSGIAIAEFLQISQKSGCPLFPREAACPLNRFRSRADNRYFLEEADFVPRNYLDEALCQHIGLGSQFGLWQAIKVIGFGFGDHPDDYA